MQEQFESMNGVFARKLVDLVATILSTKELKKNMTKKEILDLINLDLNKYTDEDDDDEQYPPIKIDRDEMPEGISMKRCLDILRQLQRGVEKGHYLHIDAIDPQTKGFKIMKPTKQQDKFVRNEKARIFGPEKAGKGKAIIEFLAKKAGRVGDPKPKKYKACIPDDWTTKKVSKLLEHVISCPEDHMVMAFSSRKVQFNEEKMVCSPDYNLCAPIKEKDKFFSLVAFLDGLDEWQNIERTPGEMPVTAKKGGKAKGKAVAKSGKGKKTAAVVDDDDEEETEEVAPPKKGRKIGKPAQELSDKKAPAKRGRKPKIVEPEESEAEVVDDDADVADAGENKDDDVADAGENKDDESVEGDDDADEGDDDEVDYDYKKMKKGISKLREDQYLHVGTMKPVDAGDETLAYDNSARIAVPRQVSDRATKALVALIRNTLAEME